VAEAIECALRDGGEAVAAIASTKRPPAAVLGLLVDAYLSLAHRDGLATSCAVTSMANDVARSNARARSAYTKQVGIYLELAGEAHRDRQAQIAQSEGDRRPRYPCRRGIDGARSERRQALGGSSSSRPPTS